MSREGRREPDEMERRKTMLTVNKLRINSALLNPGSFLGTLEFFKGVPPAAMQEIERKMVEKKYPKNASIVLEGDPVQSVYFVKDGHVKAVTHAPNGRCQTLCMVGQKGMFGSCCSLNGGTCSCQCVAETDVTVVSIPLSEFAALMSRFPQVSRALVLHFSERLRHAKQAQVFEQESVEKRLLRVLIDMVEEFGNTVPLTRREMAEMAGTTVETSIRTFSKLEEKGLVSTTRGKITVKDIRLLKEGIEEV
jgi:CRP/FNR family transcriptional regulator, nitrogen oxide reductase regulator